MLFAQLLHMNNNQSAAPAQPASTLDQVPVGKSVRILSIRPSAEDSAHHLRAYGLLAGRTVRILSHQPLTIIQIEQTELALERSVARLVEVE